MGEAQEQLLPGDSLLLYTDGIIEARSVSGGFYGNDRLQQVFGAPRANARASLEAVLSDVDVFVEEAAQSDDQTVVCLAVNDAAPRRFETSLPPAMR